MIMANTLTAIRRKLPRKVILLLSLCILAFIFYGFNWYKMAGRPLPDKEDLGFMSYRLHLSNVDTYYEQRLGWPTSTLGGILFKRDTIPYPNPNENKTFVVLVWKYWTWLKNRHVHNFEKVALGKSKNKIDNSGQEEESYLKDCSVKNCIFSGDDKLMPTADAVLVHLQRGVIPEVKNRNPRQRWVFLNDESPTHAFSLAKERPSLERFYNVFNWSMTYRTDADVPVPYGRTLPLEGPMMTTIELDEIAALVPNWRKKRRDRHATILMSNCGASARNNCLKELRKYINVDVYGKCSDVEDFKNSCPGHFKEDCNAMDNCSSRFGEDCTAIDEYVFYLVLEDTRCYQYLTENIFYNAYAKGAIPVIWGPSFDDVESLLPPYSFLFIEKSVHVEKVAQLMLNVIESDSLLLSMHLWRNTFQVVNEHGYFGSKSYHLCRLCEALNYNDEREKIYGKEDIDWILNPLKICTKTNMI